MQISYLADRPELASGLIPGLLEHWRPIVPEQTWASRQQVFQSHMNRDALPIAWVAHDGDHVLGTAALRVRDLDGRDELTPWLGGVFVLRPFRRRGIAAALCAVVEAKARALGFARLHLFRPDQERLYARLGWRPLERLSWRGFESVLMIKDLPTSHPGLP